MLHFYWDYYEIGESRFAELMIDVIGPMPSSRGNKYCLTVLDRKTRWLEALPMPEATAKSCCDALVEGWIQRFCIPCRATSDNGSTFISSLWKHVHAQLGTIVTYTPVYSPQSLGGVERSHLDLKNGLRAVLYQMNDIKSLGPQFCPGF